jgi:hypothetical protein
VDFTGRQAARTCNQIVMSDQTSIRFVDFCCAFIQFRSRSLRAGAKLVQGAGRPKGAPVALQNREPLSRPATAISLTGQITKHIK